MDVRNVHQDPEDSDEAGVLDIFAEPEGFRQPEKPYTYETITLPSGITHTNSSIPGPETVLNLRLVGHNPLWGHLLWNAGRVITNHLFHHPELVTAKAILEVGAGAGLPSLAAACMGAARVIVTDYPDADLIENLSFNIDQNRGCLATQDVRAVGYKWGDSPSCLVNTEQAESTSRSEAENRFDTIIMADLLFNHVCHLALLQTVLTNLRRAPKARALVFFTPYRPWLLEKDLAFFDLVREQGDLQVVELRKTMMEKVLFENDLGDEELRRTVFGFELLWAPSALVSS